MTRPRPPWTPPTRDGVGPSRIAVSGGPWASVAEFLETRLPAGNDWHARLARGDVLDSAGRPLAAGDPCPHGAVFWYWRCLPPEPRVPFEIDLLHQDDQLVVVDKPHFLPVTPGGRYLQETVLVRLKRLTGIDTLVPMHRLDLETAGVLVFTVLPASRHAYQSVLRERRAHKVYEAVAPWRADLALPRTVSSRLQERPGAFMQMETVDGEPNAITQVALITRLGQARAAGGELAPGAASGVLAAGAASGGDFAPGAADGGDFAHYRLTPLTGRKHQLRAHLAALGLPIVGDRIYPRLWPAPPADAAPDFTQPLQLLAREISFTDPLDGRPRRFVSRRQLALARRCNA